MLRAFGSLRQQGAQLLGAGNAGDSPDEQPDETPSISISSTQTVVQNQPVRRERGQITLRRSDSQAYHTGSQVWVPEKGLEQGLGKQKVVRWVKGRVTGTGKDAAGDTVLTVQTEEGAVRELQPSECPLQNERDDTVDDLVKSDFLHEPG